MCDWLKFFIQKLRNRLKFLKKNLKSFGFKLKIHFSDILCAVFWEIFSLNPWIEKIEISLGFFFFLLKLNFQSIWLAGSRQKKALTLFICLTVFCVLSTSSFFSILSLSSAISQNYTREDFCKNFFRFW